MSIYKLYSNNKEALALLNFPEKFLDKNNNYVFHPSLLNGAILSSVIWSIINRDKSKLIQNLPMPFSLKIFKIHNILSFSKKLYVYIKKSKNFTLSENLEFFNIQIFNTKGTLLISLLDLTLIFKKPKYNLLYATPKWKSEKLSSKTKNINNISKPRFLLIEKNIQLQNALYNAWPNSIIDIIFEKNTNDIEKNIFFEKFLKYIFKYCKNILKENNNIIQSLILLIPLEKKAFLYGGSISGFLKTACFEYTKLSAKIIYYPIIKTDNSDKKLSNLIFNISTEISSISTDVEICFPKEGKRKVRKLCEIDIKNNKENILLNIKENDVIWVIGGMGGIGRLLANYLGIIKKSHLILSGRSELNDKNLKFIEKLKNKNINISYLKTNISEIESINTTLSIIKRKYGKLDGIIHCAGIIEDNYIINKTTSQFMRVVCPKITGLLNIDVATLNLSINYIILFSSIAGFFGNIGQSDYSTGNSFMDAFADYRNQCMYSGKRSGKTLSLNWPLWLEGGMQMNVANEKLMKKATGMTAMDNISGLIAFENVFSKNYNQILIAFGDYSVIKKRLLSFKKDSTYINFTNNEKEIVKFNIDKNTKLTQNENKLSEMVRSELINIVAKVQHIPHEKISFQKNLSAYGFDSISFTEFANVLNKTYELVLMPTLFFEIQTLIDLESYLLTHHKSELIKKHKSNYIKHENKLSEMVRSELINIVAKVQHIPHEKISFQKNLSAYGFDSISFTEFANVLNKTYELVLMPTLFFEIQTLIDLESYLLTHHKSELIKKHKSNYIKHENKLSEMVRSELINIVAKVQHIPHEKISFQKNLSAYGFDSISFTEFANVLNKTYELVLMPTLFFEIQTLIDLESYLLTHHKSELIKKHKSNYIKHENKLLNLKNSLEDIDTNTIAIIGIGGKFPGSKNINDFWRKLENNEDAITEVPTSRWDWKAIYGDPHLESGKTKVKWGGFLYDADCFDANFFGISPAEAEVMDPQLRLFIETTWAALEDAGYPPSKLSGSKTAIFAGVSTADYKDILNEARHKGLVKSLAEPFPFMIANRVSYLFNFHGPSEVIDTACSSSLIAINRAIESLHLKNCDLALAGGVNILASPNITIASSKAGLLSENGRCMTFDQRANGYVRSEGVGVILLKPLKNAIIDNDHIYGIFRGNFENHGGHSSSPTSPNMLAQKQLLIDVYRRANINPYTINYIEAHGTGTKLGDPIEVNGLKSAFSELHEYYKTPLLKPYCGLGSVKANIGHLEAASGVIGVIKVLLMLKYKKIPGNPHLKIPNSYLKLDNTPFYLVNKTCDWIQLDNNIPRRAGVSSFGVGGSNVHVIIEEYRKNIKTKYIKENTVLVRIIMLSAKTKKSLKEYVILLLEFIIKEKNNFSLCDLAYTLQVGREAMKYRLAIYVNSYEDLIKKLQDYLNKKITNGIYTNFSKNNENKNLEKINKTKNISILIDSWIKKNKYDKLILSWINGYEFSWDKLYNILKPNRISLPTYPFDRQRYWVSIQPKLVNKYNNISIINKEKKIYNKKSIFTFEEVWVKSPLISLPISKVKKNNLLCFSSNKDFQNKIVESISSYTDIIFIEQSDNIKISPNDTVHYKINKDNINDYTFILNKIYEKDKKIDSVFYLWPLEDKNCIYNIMPIIYFLQAVKKSKLYLRKLIISGISINKKNEEDLYYCYFNSWVAFERSLHIIMPETQISIVFAEKITNFNIKNWINILFKELQEPKLFSIMYYGNDLIRYQLNIKSIILKDFKNSYIKQGGTYLITGGTGRLGMLFSDYLINKYSTNLILSGRSKLNSIIYKKLKKFNNKAIYIQVDVSDKLKMISEINSIINNIGPIDGVLHIAGISGLTSNILEANYKNFYSVLSSKISGTIALNYALENTILKLQKNKLDFVCYFSSSSAILGDFGSCDYAMGNRFQTVYAKYLNNKNIYKKYTNKLITINWPLWNNSKFKIGNNEQTDFYFKSSKQKVLHENDGLKLFEQLLIQDKIQYLVLSGELEKLNQIINNIAPKVSENKKINNFNIEKFIENDIKNHICNILNTKKSEIYKNKNLADYGFDSISLAEFSRILSKFYSLDIMPSIFFSYSTLERLITYFIKNHNNTMIKFYRNKYPLKTESKNISILYDNKINENYENVSKKSNFILNKNTDINSEELIAIIGMSGRFPAARNINEFWKILINNKDVISEIPEKIFDWKLYYENPIKSSNKINSKWYGSIPGIDEFDPLFFEISPLEAERMDPRQRHLLQESWLALEDAGYGPNQIANQKIGMFVGVEEGSNYQDRLDQVNLTSTHNAILSARLAYFMDLKGPVMAINTACSSSLVATHIACQSLRQHECDTAISAGVNLMISPEAYIAMTSAGMLSPDGKCYVFDERANGLVPSEAVVAVVLKRLSRALSDGDPIHAIIRGSGINYDGKTNGITAPNGISQTELIKSVYKKSNLNPEDINYIITHGTGTKLGDPVEINALHDVFKNKTYNQKFCAITSNKSNIGHTFAASGLVSLINLVQSIKYKIIPASLHCEKENNYIILKNSPFYINKSNKKWNTVNEKLRIGAVSAFGMSGTNAHIVLQEYISTNFKNIKNNTFISSNPYHMVVLSAKTKISLKEKMKQILLFLRKNNTVCIENFVYTLMQGRHHFQYRCAIIISSIEEVVKIINDTLNSKEKILHTNYLKGIVSHKFTSNKIIDSYINKLTKRCLLSKTQKKEHYENLLELGNLYCQGYIIPWNNLYPNKFDRIHLPGYLFLKEHYWIEKKNINFLQEKNPEYKKIEFSILFLNLSRIILEKKTNNSINALKNIIWGKIPEIENYKDTKLKINMYKKNNKLVYTTHIVKHCCQIGEIDLNNISIIKNPIDLNKLQKDLDILKINCKNILKICISKKFLFADILLNKKNNLYNESIFLSKALELIHIFVNYHKIIINNDLLPFSLKYIRIYKKIPLNIKLYLICKKVELNGSYQQYDIIFYDNKGNMCLKLKDLIFKKSNKLINIDEIFSNL
ncbi:SDR family NAD(P)-dependent oxidoreductase [Candidatus Profftella armatura]